MGLDRFLQPLPLPVYLRRRHAGLGQRMPEIAEADRLVSFPDKLHEGCAGIVAEILDEHFPVHRHPIAVSRQTLP
jgi:hypothetical protein